MRVLLNRESAFSRDPSPWLPTGPHHMALDFMWAVEPFTLDGKPGGTTCFAASSSRGSGRGRCGRWTP